MSVGALARQVLTAASQAGSETDDSHAIQDSLQRKTRRTSDEQDALPILSHRMRHNKSILTIALSGDKIFAGTQGGEILVFSLDTYERITVIEGHRGSVLGLCLSENESLLFSSAGDRVVNVWDTRTFRRVYWIYSTYDIGDVFCVSYSERLRTVYLGAQNTSIQWYDLKEKDVRPQPRPQNHPFVRQDHFFDSSGPGGVRTPRPAEHETRSRHAISGQALELDKGHIFHFAHYGYVYCMLLAKDINPGEDILISGGGDGVINIWRLVEPRGGAIEKMFSLDDGREEGHSILSLAIDGTFLYSGRAGGEVNVWDLETRQLVRSLKAHRDDVMSICLGGGVLFSASVTGFVKVGFHCSNCSRRLRLTPVRNTTDNTNARIVSKLIMAEFLHLPLPFTTEGHCT